MNVITTTDQAECIAALTVLEALEVFRPTPPLTICDGIIGLSEDCFIVGTNNRGVYTLHALEDCTKAEAFEFLNALRGGSAQHCNPRLHFVGGPSVPASNN